MQWRVDAAMKQVSLGGEFSTEDMVDHASGDIFSLAYPDHIWSKTIRQIAENVLAIP